MGTAWLLRARAARHRSCVRPPASCAVRHEGDLTWIAARPEWSPPFEYVELESPAEVDALAEAPDGLGWAYCWAWADECGGADPGALVRAGGGHRRGRGHRLGRAGALRAGLDAPIEVRQGRGSDLSARPLADGLAEVGGRVVLDEVRDYIVESR